MISRQQQSLSCLSNFSSHSCAPMSEWVCDKQRGSLFIYILFFHLMSTLTCQPQLTITYQIRHLQESLITLVPHNYGEFDLQSTRRVNLDIIMGIIALNYNGGLTSMTLHDLFTLLNLLIRTSGYDMRKLHYI